MLMLIQFIVHLLLLSSAWCSVIIPDELPSLLSVAYSNIPPIKKGTDSRIGFGYAFGRHADFQILLELGPQTNTNKIGQPFQSNAKREVQTEAQEKINKNKEKFMHSDAGKYLLNWSEKMRNPSKPEPSLTLRPTKSSINRPGDVPNLEDSLVELVKNEKGEIEIHQPKPDNMPQKVLNELKKLYGQKKDETKRMGEKRTEEEVKKITDDLSNVDLE